MHFGGGNVNFPEGNLIVSRSTFLYMKTYIYIYRKILSSEYNTRISEERKSYYKSMVREDKAYRIISSTISFNSRNIFTLTLIQFLINLTHKNRTFYYQPFRLALRCRSVAEIVV